VIADNAVVLEVSRRRFDELVDEALDRVPKRLLDALDNVMIRTAEINDEDPSLLGLYHGVDLTRRTHDYAFQLPDTITIYRLPLLAMCADEDELAEEIAVTVVHEIAHHFGIPDERLHELGWG
jgi:predicted Zn-dependent protease with MMP-like domain